MLSVCTILQLQRLWELKKSKTMLHKVKCINPFFEDVLAGRKTFEVRRNDRKYKVGDLILLWEYNPDREMFLDRHCLVEVIYVYKEERYRRIGLRRGYVVLGIKNFEAPQS